MENSLKSYPPRWEGDLLLACRECQKKLKGEPGMGALAKLKKTIKRRNRKHSGRLFHLVSIPCMDICPKNAVTICLPSRQPITLSILRNEGELDGL